MARGGPPISGLFTAFGASGADGVKGAGPASEAWEMLSDHLMLLLLGLFFLLVEDRPSRKSRPTPRPALHPSTHAGLNLLRSQV